MELIWKSPLGTTLVTLSIAPGSKKEQMTVNTGSSCDSSASPEAKICEIRVTHQEMRVGDVFLDKGRLLPCRHLFNNIIQAKNKSQPSL